MTKHETILSLKGLSKSYGESIAVDNIDLSVQKGEFLTFLGPSGSGKTTTLNLIAGFVEPSQGTMLLNERPLEKLKTHERNLGVVFQHYALFPHMTVAENIEYSLKQRKVSKGDRRDRVREALEMVQLAEYADRYPKQLSGGQQQRVALARVVVYRPPILLMDEPLGALDKKLRDWLQLELRRIHRELGSTFIYVTHDQEEALVLSDRIAIFNNGKIEQIGTPGELYAEPKTLFVGKFIGESSVFSVTKNGADLAAGEFHFTGISNLADGPVAILVRPENLELSDPLGASLSPGAVNRVSGVIDDKIYLGSAVKYNITTPLGKAVVRMPQERAVAFEIGSEVVVAWRPEKAVLLVDEN